MEYPVNKGVNRPLDLYGLKEQYILFFAAGLIVGFIVYFVFAFFSQVVAIILTAVVVLTDYLVAVFLNRRYGVHGQAKELAMKSCPRRVKPQRIRKIIKCSEK